MAGNELALYSGQNTSRQLVVRDPEVLAQEQAKRTEDALVLEEKLRVIQESVPTRVYNTCSSSAGAGSSDFHMYRMIRKTEQERWKRIEAQNAAAEEQAAFEAKRKEREQDAEERTAKNRAKRQKKKAKAKAAKRPNLGEGGPSESGTDKEDEEDAARKAKVPEQPDLD